MSIPKPARIPLAVVGLILIAGVALADADQEEKIYPGPEIVVTASRIEWPVEKTASFFTVISRSDIERRRAESVGELLRSVAGLTVVQSGSRGKASSLFVRGANSNHCLVLLDGAPVNDPTTGAFDFSELSPINIERIEIVRGPHGILYGSNAIGGVINIITTSKDYGRRREISLAGGSYGSAEGAVSVSGSERSYSYSYTLSGARSDGLGANDFYRNLALSGSASSEITATSRVSVSLRYAEADNGLRGPWFAADPNAEQSGGHFIVSASYRQFVSGHWSYLFRTSFLSREITWKDPVDSMDSGPFVGDGFSEINSRVKNIAWQNDIRLSQEAWLISGVEWKEEQTTNSGYSPFGTTSFDDRTRNLSLFANGILDLARLPTASAGVRLDDHSEFGTVSTYKVSLSYPLPGIGGVIKGSVGTGFRAPSLNELYYPGYGNPALRPENTVGYDIGLRHDLSRSMASVEIAYFDNSYRNMIASNPVTWLADNIGRARSYGMELQASFRPSGAITLQGSYAYTRTEDASTGKQLLRRPRNSGACSVAYHGGSYELVASGVFVGRRLDNDFGGPFGEYMSSPYSTYDLALTYRIGGSRELFCKLANVSDERYEEIAGYPASGFGVMAGTKMEF